MKTFIIAAAMAATIMVFTGCTTTRVSEGPAPAVKVDSPDAPYATVRMNAVAILDKSLQKWNVYREGKSGGEANSGKIALESSGARRTATGNVEVWATLRNRTDYPLQVEGRVQFFDAAEAPVEGPSAWQRVMLPPQSVASYKEFSVNPDVSYYYIEVREGR